MDLSFLSRVLPRRKKRDLFLGICITESSGICYAFEQTPNDVELVQDFPFEYADGFNSVLDDVDKAVYTIEKSLSYSFKRALFIVPSLALGVQQKEISAPYRSVVADIMHNLEFEAMGYIEMIDCYKELIGESHSSAYVEMGKDDTLIIFNRRTNHWKTLVVKTHLANVLNHLDEFLTKGTTLYVKILHKSIQPEQIIPAIHQYSVTICTDQTLHIGLLQLLKAQLLTNTTSSKPVASTPLHADQENNMDAEEILIAQTPETQTNTLPEDETLIIETKQIAVPGKEDTISSYEAQTSNVKVVAQNDDKVEGFTIFTNNNGEETTYIQQPPSSDVLHTKEYVDSVSIQDIEGQDTNTENEAADETALEEITLNTVEDAEIKEEAQTDTPSIQPPMRLLQSLRSLGVGFVIVFSAIALSLVTVELFIHKVTIKAHISTQIEDVSADLTGIPLSKTVEKKDISASIPATGEKEVGDRAKGKVIIASFDDKEASFSAGTRLILDNEPYQLDEDVVLPPASFDTSSGTKTASKKAVNASASFIGSEGNVEKGKQFTIDEYPASLYYAITETSFSGGTRRTVSVVSKEDIADLKAMITKKGKDVSETVRSQTGDSVIVLDDISSVDLSEIQYSADQGEIASRIDAEGSVKADLYAIEKNAVFDYLAANLKKDKGDGYQFVDDGSTYKFSDIELSEDETTVSFTLEAKVRSYKKIDSGRIRSISRLKTLSAATQSLDRELGIQKVDFDFSPVLPLFQSFVPYRTDHIGVEIKPSAE